MKVPTLLLMGADNPVVPPINGRILASRLSQATLEKVACGHLFVLTRPAETARRVERSWPSTRFRLDFKEEVKR